MMRPQPLARMCGIAARLAVSAGMRFTPRVACQSSTVSSRERPGPPCPADVVDQDVNPAELGDGAGDGVRRGGGFGQVRDEGEGADAAGLDLTGGRGDRFGAAAATPTWQPSSASPSAMARPRPRLAPVTSATLSRIPRSTATPYRQTNDRIA